MDERWRDVGSWDESGDVTIKESLTGKYRGVVEKKFELGGNTASA